MGLDEQEIKIKELEVAIERLQALYNQYFMGIEKLEPLIVRKDVERKINALRKIRFNNTALRFRFQTQVQKFSTHQNHWRRICRQIEEGTYQRDIRRAEKRIAQRDVQDAAAKALAALGEDTTDHNDTFDLNGALDGIDDPFGDSASLDAELARATEAASRSIDETGPSLHSTSNSHTAGVKVPASSVTASRKTDINRNNGTSSDAPAADELKSFFVPHRPHAAPPPPPSAGNRDQPKNNPLPPPTSTHRPGATPPNSLSATASRATAGDTTGRQIDEARMKAVYRAYVAARRKTNETVDNINYGKVAHMLQKTIQKKEGVQDFKVVIRNGKAVIKTIK